MSVRVMAMIWDDGPQDATERFVLVAIADISDDAGVCWPSVATIARRCCMSERNARRIIRKLEISGWLSTEQHPGRNKSNTYRVTKPDTAMSARTDCPPGQIKHENRTNQARKPDTAMSAEPLRTIIEPSLLGEMPKKRRRPEQELPPDWVPSDRNIQDAEARHFSAQEIDHEADRFRNYHQAKGTRYRDWDAAWRTWLGNARSFKAGNAGTGSAHQNLFAGFQRAASRIS